MQFGLFVYFQDRGTPTTAVYDENLGEIELAEELGYDEVWLAEHHFSTYGMIPSPNLILANLAGRAGRAGQTRTRIAGPTAAGGDPRQPDDRPGRGPSHIDLT